MNPYQSIENIEEFEQALQGNDIALIYYSNEACNVCKVLKPQVAQLCLDNFPKMRIYEVDITKQPEIASQQSIFTMPTIIVYAMGKEWIRKSRYIGIEELKSVIDRLYQQIF